MTIQELIDRLTEAGNTAGFDSEVWIGASPVTRGRKAVLLEDSTYVAEL